MLGVIVSAVAPSLIGGLFGSGADGGSVVAGNSYVTWIATRTRYGALT